MLNGIRVSSLSLSACSQLIRTEEPLPLVVIGRKACCICCGCVRQELAHRVISRQRSKQSLLGEQRPICDDREMSPSLPMATRALFCGNCYCRQRRDCLTVRFSLIGDVCFGFHFRMRRAMRCRRTVRGLVGIRTVWRLSVTASVPFCDSIDLVQDRLFGRPPLLVWYRMLASRVPCAKSSDVALVDRSVTTTADDYGLVVMPVF